LCPGAVEPVPECDAEVPDPDAPCRTGIEPRWYDGATEAVNEDDEELAPHPSPWELRLAVSEDGEDEIPPWRDAPSRLPPPRLRPS
jgi:hypothetical protein